MISEEEKQEEIKFAGDYLAQVYVIHQSGIVIVKRKYKSGCISSDPQLIGAFLNSISTFIQDISRNKACEWDEGNRHRLMDIGMSCSRWYIKNDGNYALAMLVPNDSPIVEKQRWDMIDELGLKILDSFNIFSFFSGDSDNDPEFIVDFSDDFGKTIDHILFESISEQFQETVQFREGIDIEIENKETTTMDKLTSSLAILGESDDLEGGKRALNEVPKIGSKSSSKASLADLRASVDKNIAEGRDPLADDESTLNEVPKIGSKSNSKASLADLKASVEKNLAEGRDPLADDEDDSTVEVGIEIDNEEDVPDVDI